MKKSDYEGLLQSIREGGAILRGEMEPSRRYTAEEILGPERVAFITARHRTGLTQDGFAEVMGVSARTVQEWERGRREPTGAARALILVMAAHPEIVIETVAKAKALRETRQHPKFVARVARRGRPKKSKTG